jgi:hypothetical protein
MADRTGLSNIIAAAVHGRSSTVADQFRVPATGEAAPKAEAVADPEPADLSLAGHVLLPVGIFTVTLLTLEFLLSADLACKRHRPGRAAPSPPQCTQLRLDHHWRHLCHCAGQRRHRR